VQHIREFFTRILAAVLDLVRAQIDRKSIFAYDPTSAGAEDYQHLIDEILGNVVMFPKRRRAAGGTIEK
jgi:cellulose biosynthesis protein BcsQ